MLREYKLLTKFVGSKPVRTGLLRFFVSSRARIIKPPLFIIYTTYDCLSTRENLIMVSSASKLFLSIV
jgi:hypothetical protein